MFVRLWVSVGPLCVCALAATSFLAFAAPAAVAQKAAQNAPRVLCLSQETLAQNKTKLQNGDKALRPAYEQLLRDADKALRKKPESVMDKTLVPPSGDKHDYLSLAPYFWPDPTKKDGLPYIRHDGRHNPEADDEAKTDESRWSRTTSAIDTLALAYYFSGKKAYADHAALLLRTWFIKPETAMRPNLQFGQAIRGVNDGRGAGIVKTASLVGVCDSVGLLAGSPSWTKADAAGMQKWMTDYLTWLQTSKNGKKEADANNNHGSWYGVQVVALALFTSKNDLARTVAEAAKEKRLAAQIEPDGSLPKELVRTKSLSYSVFDLTAFVKLATLADRVGVDLWHYQTPAGGRGSIEKVVLNLAPYANPAKKWPGQQIAAENRMTLVPLLWQAAPHYPAIAAQLRTLSAKTGLSSDDRAWLLYPLAAGNK